MEHRDGLYRLFYALSLQNQVVLLQNMDNPGDCTAAQASRVSGDAPRQSRLREIWIIAWAFTEIRCSTGLP